MKFAEMFSCSLNKTSSRLLVPSERNGEAEADSGSAAVASSAEETEPHEAEDHQNISDSGTSQLPSDLPAGTQRSPREAAGTTGEHHV